MADTYGAVALPVVAGEGDPALARLGAYLRAVVNGQAGAAWAALRPRQGAAAEPIRFVRLCNPEEEGFNDNELPALYLYREGGAAAQPTDDGRTNESTIRMLWAMPSGKQGEVASWKAFGHAVAQAIDDAIERGRDPLWADAGDPDPGAEAIEAATASVVLPIVTSTSPTALSGASLTGPRAGATFNPRLAPTATTALTAVDTYNTAAPILWTVVDWYGRTRTLSRLLTEVRGGETVTVPEDVVRITAVAIPAQLSTAGTISIGTGPWAARGSLLRSRCGFASITPGAWTRAKVTIEVLGEGERVDHRRSYPALSMAVVVTERRVVDPTNRARFHPTGLDLDTTQGGMVAQRSLPDAP